MKRFLLFLLLPISAFAQGIFIPARTVNGTVNGITRPIPAATITVCAANTAGIPCSPALTSTVFKDSGLTVPLSNPFLTDANGNYPQVAVPGGIYTITESAPGFAGFSYQITVSCAPGAACTVTNFTANTVSFGNGNSFSPVTFSNHNNVFWAGPGGTPTIDQAVAQCTLLSLPCQVDISPGYTGPESTNLVTTSLGYKVYSGGLQVTVLDRRQNLATPGAPANAPLYSVMFGGRLAGQLTRTGTNFWCNGANDSCVANTSFAWISGNLATPAFGSQMGSAGVAVVHGTVTNVTSAPNIVGADAEVGFDPTSVDAAFNAVLASSAQVHIDRTNAVGAVAFGIAHRAQPCTNISSSGGFLQFCFGYDAKQSTAGQANYGFHNEGNWLSESGSLFDVAGPSFTISSISESGTTVTVTTSATCPFVAGQRVRIINVGTSSPTVAQLNYWGVWTVVSACSGGTTFTYTATASSLPTVSGSGNAQTVASLFNTAGSFVTMTAYNDANGFLYTSLGGSNLFRITPSAAITSFLPHIFNANINLINGALISNTAPTIAAAGCGGAAASIVVNNGTAAFKVNVGTTPTSACTLTFPAATTGWNVTCNDITTQSASVFVQKQTGAESTTSVTITNFNTSAAATAFVASDILKCTAFAD